MAKQRFFRGMYNRIFFLIVTFLLGSNCLFAAEQADASERPGYDIFLLKHISVEQGKKYLAELGIGTVSNFPGSSALLVTAQPRELTKAKAIMNLVDVQEKFAVEEVLLASAGGNMPSNEQVATKLGNISIGSFSNPPTGQSNARAIIDIHNDAVVVVAPVNKLEKILSTIEQLQEPNNNQVQSVLKAQDKLEAPDNKNKAFNLPGSNGPEPRFATSKAGTQPNTVAAMLEQKAADTIIPNKNALAETALNQRITEQTAVVQPQELESIPNAEEVLKLDLPEKITIVDLLGLAGEYLQLDFLYDPSEVEGEVTFKLHGKLRGAMKVKDLYPLLESVLKFKGFVMTRKGNLVLVAPQDQALAIDPVLVEPQQVRIERGDVVVTRLFELEHISTATATEFLEDMKLSLAVSSIAETGTLIVTGYTYRMARIERLLEMVDKPGRPKKFRSRQLRYTMAQTLAPKLQTLSEQLGTVSITIAAATPTTPTVPTKRPNETQAQYRRRVILAQQAAKRAAAAQQAERAAEPTKPTVFIDADERTNRIMMIGLDEQLDVVDELIDTLDVVQQDLRTFQPYKIKHVDAVDVKRKLEELHIISPSPTTPYSSAITNGIKQPTQQPTATGPQAAARAQAARTALAKEQMEDIETGSLVEEPQVVVIEPSNSLLVNATEEQHARIASIISYVDSEILEDEIPYKIYPLENSSPEHMAGLLERLIQETVVDKEGKIQEVRARQEEPPIIVPDPNTFSLIVYATKKDQEWISSLIETLDKRRPQVLIDVTLVEVSRVDLFDLDLDIVSKYGGFTSGGEMEVVEALLSPFPEKRVIEGGSFSGAGTAFYSDRNIQALLRAVQTKSYGRVLAKPKILVNDGQPGTIRTTDKTNVRTEQIIIPEEGTQRTATSFLEFTAGIELIITPNISEGDLLLLKVNMTRSDFTDTPVEGAPPNTTESVVDTTVTVPDGKTIILGGLIKLNQTKGGSKIPILGDIPILGGLFRSTSNTDRESNLYVFVKANILRPDETLEGLPDLERMSERNRIAFERFEDRFQRYEDWPGFKPQPMEPPRVLETE